jgi:predicted nucleic acid-binding protein
VAKQVCIDASLAIEWLLPEIQDGAADALRHDWNVRQVRLVSSPLFDAEVTSTLRRQVYSGKIPPEEGEIAFELYLGLGVRTITNPSVARLAWEMARRFNMPRTHDLQYLAVAELVDCPLWTCDRRFVNSLGDKVPRIRLAGDFGK